MDKHSIETIELEMAVLFRRLTSITTFKNRQSGSCGLPAAASHCIS
ncbi:hypothetical protein ACFSQ7_39150 [Paenibacillus rhizoplanae]